jgi:cytoskeletal protein CcmA (bactofilin family)
MEASKTIDPSHPGLAHIGKSVIIKGELSGSEDLYLDGEVEGRIELLGHNLVVGPNGRVRAHIRALDVVVEGKVDGNVDGADRVVLKKSAILVGDIVTQRIVIEEGAYFKGGIDIQKEAPKVKPQASEELGRGMAQSAAAPAGGDSSAAQGSLLEVKK